MGNSLKSRFGRSASFMKEHNISSTPEFGDDQPIVAPQIVEESTSEAQITAYGVFGFNYLQLSPDKLQEIPCAISIESSIPTGASQGTGVDIVCVIDVSGSMSGEKINLVKRTLNFMVDQLPSHARVCLISFENHAHKLSPLTAMSSAGKEVIRQRIDTLKAGGGTNIVEGLYFGLEALRQRRAINQMSSVILLTDGQDNNRNTAFDRAMSAIDFVSIPDGYSIHTFGYGANHDSNLLGAIAENKNGGFYYVKDEDTISSAFANCLGELVSVVADQIEVRLLTQSAQIPFSLSKVYSRTGDNSFNLPPLLAGDKKEAVFLVSFPPTAQQVESGLTIQPVCFRLKYRNVARGEVVEGEFPISLRVENADYSGEIEVDTDVLVNFYRVKTADMMDQATELANQGQFEAAKELLVAGNRELLASVVSSHEVVQSLATDLLRSVQEYQDAHAWEDGGKHTMKTRARNHSAKRGMEMECYQNVAQKAMFSAAKSAFRKS